MKRLSSMFILQKLWECKGNQGFSGVFWAEKIESGVSFPLSTNLDEISFKRPTLSHDALHLGCFWSKLLLWRIALDPMNMKRPILFPSEPGPEQNRLFRNLT